MKKLIAKIVLMSMMVTPLTAILPTIASAAPNWDTTGSYVINMNYLGSDYAHDMNLTQDNMGVLTGNGGSPSGSNTYTWTITSGTSEADTIDFWADYTATADAVTPQTSMHVMGTIAPDGTISGTWSDNYQGGERAGTWASTSGNAQDMPDEAPATVTVTIVKYIDGAMATAVSGQNTDFQMSATWDAENIGAGTGQYALSETGYNGDPTPYQAKTTDMSSGADYSTSEIMDSTTASSCPAEGTEGGATFALVGYSTGDSLQEAIAGTTSMSSSPSFTNMTSDKFVVVRNITCGLGSEDDGGLGGTVDEENGVLKVDSITVVKSSATADGTFAGGWKYVFHITDPSNEPKLAMKFADWMSGANMVPVANNMRISSLQADNGGATILLTSANTYSTPALNMVTDLDPSTIGRQVDVTVEVAIPVGTVAGSYTTTYGVNSNQ